MSYLPTSLPFFPVTALLGLLTACGGGNANDVIVDGGPPVDVDGGPPVDGGSALTRGVPYGPTIAVDKDGNAIAMWLESDSLGDVGDAVRFPPNLWANRYDASTASWGAPARIHRIEPTTTMDPAILKTNADGDAVAVWGAGNDIWTIKLSTTSSTWGAPSRLDHPELTASSYDVDIDSQGNVVAVWTQDGDAAEFVWRYDVWARRWDASLSTWGVATLLETNDEVHADDPKVGLDAAGNAIAVWRQDRDEPRLWSSRYDITSDTWDTVPQILNDTDVSYSGHHVIVDDNGDALVLWDSEDDPGLTSRHYDAAIGSWSGRQTVAEETDRSFAVAGQPSSQVVVLSEKKGGGDPLAIWGCFHATGCADADPDALPWGSAEPIETIATPITSFPAVAANRSGNATAVWSGLDDSGFVLWASQAQSVWGAWGDPEAIASGPFAIETGRHPNFKVDIDVNGNALVVWIQGEQRHVWSRRYDSGSSSWGEPQLVDGP